MGTVLIGFRDEGSSLCSVNGVNGYEIVLISHRAEDSSLRSATCVQNNCIRTGRSVNNITLLYNLYYIILVPVFHIVFGFKYFSIIDIHRKNILSFYIR